MLSSNVFWKVWYFCLDFGAMVRDVLVPSLINPINTISLTPPFDSLLGWLKTLISSTSFGDLSVLQLLLGGFTGYVLIRSVVSFLGK